MPQEFLFHCEFISERDVEPVAEALVGCSWSIEFHRSSFDGTLYLRTRHTEEIDIAMESGQSHRFLSSGGVGGTLERALALIADFSRCLTDGGFTHRVEVYDDASELVGYFHARR